MTPHGPDSQTYDSAVDEEKTKGPERVSSTTLAFMFEVSALPHVTPASLASPYRDENYHQCWEGLKVQYTGPPEPGVLG
jgi:homogentisate 1,2-dioxygenase